MKHFGQIVKHYLLLAIRQSGGNIDSDMAREIDEALDRLNAFVNDMENRLAALERKSNDDNA